MSSNSNRKSIILDTGAIINGFHFDNMNDLIFYVPKSIVDEIRDSKSKRILYSLPYELKILDPIDENLSLVKSYAMRTGDFANLSPQDFDVLALTYELEVKQHGTKHIKPLPMKVEVKDNIYIALTPHPSYVEAFEFDDDDDEEEDAAAADDDDDDKIQKDIGVFNKVTNLHDDNVTDNNDSLVKQEKDFSEQTAAVNSKKEENRIKGDINEEIVVEDEDDNGGFQVFHGKDKNQRRKNKKKTKNIERSTALDSFSGNNSSISAVLKSSIDKNNSSSTIGTCLIDSIPNGNASQQEEHHQKEFDAEMEQQNDEGEGGKEEWINADNVESYKQLSHICSKDEEDSSMEEDTVGCITGDFSIQNVLLHMGLQLLSDYHTSGNIKVIKQLKHWVKRCHCCGTLVVNIRKIFCPRCGHPTLLRVTVETDTETGELVCYYNPKRKISTRGIRFPIPYPEGGKRNKDPILREDQLKSYSKGTPKKNAGLLKKGGRNGLQQQQNNAVFDQNYNWEATFKGDVSKKLQAKQVSSRFHLYNGYGKKNPNVVSKH